MKPSILFVEMAKHIETLSLCSYTNHCYISNNPITQEEIESNLRGFLQIMADLGIDVDARGEHQTCLEDTLPNDRVLPFYSGEQVAKRRLDVKRWSEFASIIATEIPQASEFILQWSKRQAEISADGDPNTVSWSDISFPQRRDLGVGSCECVRDLLKKIPVKTIYSLLFIARVGFNNVANWQPYIELVIDHYSSEDSVIDYLMRERRLSKLVRIGVGHIKNDGLSELESLFEHAIQKRAPNHSLQGRRP